MYGFSLFCFFFTKKVSKPICTSLVLSWCMKQSLFPPKVSSYWSYYLFLMIFFLFFFLYNVMAIWQDKCDAVSSPFCSSAVFHPSPLLVSSFIFGFIHERVYFSSHSFTGLEKRNIITWKIWLEKRKKNLHITPSSVNIWGEIPARNDCNLKQIIQSGCIFSAEMAWNLDLFPGKPCESSPDPHGFPGN